MGGSYASLTYFGDMLRCPHKRIVTITKVYIATNNIHVEIIRFRENSRLYSSLRLRGDTILGPLYVYSIFARWQQLFANTLITIHSPDDSTPRYARRRRIFFRPGVTVCACMRFACVIRSGYLVGLLANQHTSSEGQGSRDLRQTRVEPY